jgi:hypothetical protein
MNIPEFQISEKDLLPFSIERQQLNDEGRLGFNISLVKFYPQKELLLAVDVVETLFMFFLKIQAKNQISLGLLDDSSVADVEMSSCFEYIGVISSTGVLTVLSSKDVKVG